MALDLIQRLAGLFGDLICTKTIMHTSALCERRLHH